MSQKKQRCGGKTQAVRTSTECSPSKEGPETMLYPPSRISRKIWPSLVESGGCPHSGLRTLSVYPTAYGATVPEEVGSPHVPPSTGPYKTFCPSKSTVTKLRGLWIGHLKIFPYSEFLLHLFFIQDPKCSHFTRKGRSTKFMSEFCRPTPSHWQLSMCLRKT